MLRSILYILKEWWEKGNTSCVYTSREIFTEMFRTCPPPPPPPPHKKKKFLGRGSYCSLKPCTHTHTHTQTLTHTHSYTHTHTHTHTQHACACTCTAKVCLLYKIRKWNMNMHKKFMKCYYRVHRATNY